MDLHDLKKIAEQMVKPRQLSPDCSAATVACALLSDKGNVFTGVCIDTCCGMGFCAEHAAIAQMITNEESRILKIVAVGENGKVYPPCGRCREFMYQINHDNIETEVLVGENKSVKLDELLPFRFQE